MRAPPGERIRTALATASTAGPSPATTGRPVALGWATVELDRAAAELALDLGLATSSFVPADDSVALGARCRVAREALGGGRSLVILEPSTEGRLAAMLARSGEGPAAIWLAGDDDPAIDATAPTRGPFGPERRLRDDLPHGLHRFLVDSAPGTIDR